MLFQKRLIFNLLFFYEMATLELKKLSLSLWRGFFCGLLFFFFLWRNETSFCCSSLFPSVKKHFN